MTVTTNHINFSHISPRIKSKEFITISNYWEHDLILDGAGYHQAELVKNIAYVLNIELHYLPPYSPNLNPIERLWNYMNEQVRNNIYFPDAKTFRETLRHFFHITLPEKAKELTTQGASIL
nr:transposase [Xenorhabdus sp. KK7.4]